MQHWLMKSEPNIWSIEQQKKAGKRGIVWDGVRNYQAANNLKKMKIKDLCFFYHSCRILGSAHASAISAKRLPVTRSMLCNMSNVPAR